MQYFHNIKRKIVLYDADNVPPFTCIFCVWLDCTVTYSKSVNIPKRNSLDNAKEYCYLRRLSIFSLCSFYDEHTLELDTETKELKILYFKVCCFLPNTCLQISTDIIIYYGHTRCILRCWSISVYFAELAIVCERTCLDLVFMHKEEKTRCCLFFNLQYLSAVGNFYNQNYNGAALTLRP